MIFNYTHDYGGRAVLIRNDLPHGKMNITTNIQAVALTTTLHKAVNICSTYIPSRDEIDKNEIKNLIDQLPRPFILLGDFNNHNTLWGCKDKKKRVKCKKS